MTETFLNLQIADGEAAGLAALFSLLSDRTRVRILGALAAGEASVGELQQRLALPQPTVSHHLTILRTGRLVVGRRGGKQVFYTLGERVRSEGGAIRVAAGELSVRVVRDVTPPTPAEYVPES